MKTLIRAETNLSLYIFDDAVAIVQTQSMTTVGDPVEFNIADCGTDNSTLISDVTPPSDWAGCKYFFDGTTWELNPDYVEPITPE